MMRRWIGVSLFGICLVTGVAAAQTTKPTPAQPAPTGQPTATTPNTGSFTQLSPGNQKIAQALYTAQKPPAGTTSLTLDQIAAMKQSGKGWGEIFKEMKAQGLVQAKNLGQVVSTYSRQQRTGSVPSGGPKTTVSGRTQAVTDKGKSGGTGSKGDADQGAASGPAVTGGGSRGSGFGPGSAEMGGGGGHVGGQGGARGK